MPHTKVGVGVLAVGLLLACDKDPVTPGRSGDRYEVRLSPDSSVLLAGDTLRITTVVLNRDSVIDPSPAIRWESLDSMIARVDSSGRVFGHAVGSTRISATVNGASDTVRIRVAQVNGCGSSGGSQQRLTIRDTTWRALASPHLISDTITVTGQLTIEAGAIICAQPGALIRLDGGALRAEGRPNRRIQFVALDTVQGWRGIAASPGLILLKYADVPYAAAVSAGFQSSLVVENSTFRRVFVGTGGANFSAFTIRHSVVEDGTVQFSSGTFEETAIRRGGLSLFPAQPGSGAVTLNGGRIEDSPGMALTIGSSFSFRVPVITVVNAPEIVGSRGGLVHSPPREFFALWPTAAAQAALLNNFDRTVRLWGNNYGSMELRGGLAWQLQNVIGQATIDNMTIGAGATVQVQAFFQVTGNVAAVGSAAEPIRVSSPTTCLGSLGGCSLTLRDTAQSHLSYVSFANTSLNAGERHVIRLDHVSSDRSIRIASIGSTIQDSEIHALTALGFPYDPAAALILEADSVTAERVMVRNVTVGTGIPAVLINGNHISVHTCDVLDNTGDGIAVRGGMHIRINECNIERNGRLGINNQTTTVVDARRNWWGDPAGPHGPTGDGVSAMVDFSSPLPARRQ